MAGKGGAGRHGPLLSEEGELSTEGNCLLWGARVIVPRSLQAKVLDEIHEGHPGISRMKSFARSYVWWPTLNADLEAKVRTCVACQQSRKAPPGIPMQLWDWPEKPWTRIHVDHAGPFMGKTLLIVVDAHSKWIEASVVSSTSAVITIDKLRHMFTGSLRSLSLTTAQPSLAGSSRTSLAATGLSTSPQPHTTPRPMDLQRERFRQ